MGKSLDKEASKDANLAKILRVVISICEYSLPKLEVTRNSFFERDLGLDSLARYEILYGIEEEFDMSIPDDKVWDFEKIGDYYEYIEHHNNHHRQ